MQTRVAAHVRQVRSVQQSVAGWVQQPVHVALERPAPTRTNCTCMLTLESLTAHHHYLHQRDYSQLRTIGDFRSASKICTNVNSTNIQQSSLRGGTDSVLLFLRTTSLPAPRLMSARLECPGWGSGGSPCKGLLLGCIGWTVLRVGVMMCASGPSL